MCLLELLRYMLFIPLEIRSNNVQQPPPQGKLHAHSQKDVSARIIPITRAFYSGNCKEILHIYALYTLN